MTIGVKKYFVIESQGKPLCLLGGETQSVIKEYNIERHYLKKHVIKFHG